MHAREPGTAAALARVMRRALGCALAALAVVATPAFARDPITPLGDVHRGLHCTALTVVQGTTISSFDVDVLDVIAGGDGIGPYILVHVSGPAVDGTGIAEGFSGSPVYCPDAHGVTGNAGAISATIGQYGNDVGLVTPIEQMLGQRARPVAGVRHAPRLLRRARPIASPLTFAGLSPTLGGLLERAARRAGRTLVAVPAGPLGTFAPQELVPGASLSVLFSRGAVTAGGVGTVTYRDGAKVWGFGHPLDGAGRRALMLGDAYVFTVVSNPLGFPPLASYKLALPGHALGTLSNDAPSAVVGTVGATPPMVPVTVRVRDLDRGRTLQRRTEVADEVDVGNPSGEQLVSLVGSVAVMEAVDEAFNGGAAQESGRMCVRALVRESSKPLRFCNRYVVDGTADEGMAPISFAMGGDASTALAKIDEARFAKLHVTEIAVDATISRGLRLATMLAAHAPRTVRPGQVVPVTVKTRLFRGPLRTVRFKLRIPREARPGRRALVLLGTPAQGDGDFFDLLFGLFGGFGEAGPAQSFAQLLARFAHVTSYDGVSARLERERWHVYRDPRLRIDGHALLPVRIVRHKRGGGSPADGRDVAGPPHHVEPPPGP